MSSFIFITDLHIQNSSNVRTGSYLDDVCNKLRFVVKYANENNAHLLIGGDVFHKPSVPDIVKNAVIPILLECKNKIYSIYGNHDCLFNSWEYADKTSYQLLVRAGIVSDFTNSTVDLGDTIISNEQKVHEHGKPLLFVKHGFLNVDDGAWSFFYQDIEPLTSETLILLGHDHRVYPPLNYAENVTILRPGSFSRVTREEASMRQPNLLHIVSDGRHITFKEVEIAARPFSEVFVAKQATITKSQQHETYEDIIAQIKSAQTINMSFEDALKTVTTDSVIDYIQRAVTNARQESITNNKNL